MSAHIGIVGCSSEGAALCYRTICIEAERRLGGHAHPEISMHTPSLSHYVRALETGDDAAVAALMLDSAERLARSGADFLICPDNTIHQALARVLPKSPLPWLSIAEVVADEAKRTGLRRLGILGTRWLVGSEVYPAALGRHGIEALRPEEADRERVSRIIMDELVRGDCAPASRAMLVAVVDRLRGAGADGVVLGCTELPLVLDDASAGMPALDSTRLLARAAVARALNEDGM